jgi:hypothetical protein
LHDVLSRRGLSKNWTSADQLLITQKTQRLRRCFTLRAYTRSVGDRTRPGRDVGLESEFSIACSLLFVFFSYVETNFIEATRHAVSTSGEFRATRKRRLLQVELMGRRQRDRMRARCRRSSAADGEPNGFVSDQYVN